MAVATATFETGVDGANVLSSDPGSLTAWDDTFGGTATQYSNTHALDTLSCRFTSAGGSHWLEWTTGLGTLTNYFGRAYLWMDTLPSGFNYTFHRFFEGTDEGGRIMVTDAVGGGAGALRITSGAGTTLVTGAVTCATAQWIRVEWGVVNSTTVGQIEAKLFNTAHSTTPTETLTSTADQNTRATTTKAWFGPADPTGAGYVSYIDNIVEGAAAYPGPSQTDVLQVLAMQSHVFGHNRW